MAYELERNLQRLSSHTRRALTARWLVIGDMENQEYNQLRIALQRVESVDLFEDVNTAPHRARLVDSLKKMANANILSALSISRVFTMVAEEVSSTDSNANYRDVVFSIERALTRSAEATAVLSGWKAAASLDDTSCRDNKSLMRYRFFHKCCHN